MGKMSPDNQASTDVANVHIVLLGDSTLDNGRYLNLAGGELSVEKQLSKRCLERGWEMTVLAQDGSMLEDVLLRQIPLIPECTTHIIMSASGNDLLSLLNQMVMANFSMRSMYNAIIQGLAQVAERYNSVLKALTALGCHVACCTVYRPNFNQMFFKSLATVSLGLHNSRLKQISAELDCSVIDLANMFDCDEDFANPLELSTRGGSKLVENIASFVIDQPVLSMQRYRHAHNLTGEDDAYGPMTLGAVQMKCCATRLSRRKVYSSKNFAEALVRPDMQLAGGDLGKPLQFSEDQEQWRRNS